VHTKSHKPLIPVWFEPVVRFKAKFIFKGRERKKTSKGQESKPPDASSGWRLDYFLSLSF
jgi:hypothetical protein